MTKRSETHTTYSSTVLIACVSTCLAVASVYLTQPIFAEIAKTFNIPIGSSRITFGVSSIAYALAFFFLGPLSDYVSSRKMTCIGLVLTAISLAAVAMVERFDFLLVLMAVSGLSAAMVPSAMFALLPRIAQREQVGTFFGLIIAASVIGITIGRAGMGILAGSVGWQHAFLIVAGLLMFTAVVTLLALPRESANHTNRPLSIGSAYKNGLSMLIAPRLLLLFTTGFLLFFGYLGVVTFLTFRLQQAPFTYNSTEIGLISLVGVSAALGAPLSGRLTTKIGAIAVAFIGLGIVTLAIIGIQISETGFSVSISLFMLFLGVFTCQPAIFVQITSRVGSDRRGTASSLYLLTCLGSGGLSSFLLGNVWVVKGWSGITITALVLVLTSAVTLFIDTHMSRKYVDSSSINSM